MMASTTMRPIQPRQIQKKRPSFFSVPSGSRLGVWATASEPAMLVTGDPRVDEGEGEIEAEVDQHDGHRHHQGDALDDGVVSLVDGGDQLEAESVHGEEDLNDERAGNEAPDGD